jgi:hypothetical protein
VLKSSVAPLWDNNNFSEIETATPTFAQEDSSKGNQVHLKQRFQQKCAKVTIDAEVAKQLLKDLLVDPLQYADFDPTPPMTQAQLDFLLSRLDSVSDPPLAADDSITLVAVQRGCMPDADACQTRSRGSLSRDAVTA